MRHELMINSDVVKALRAKRGWSQDQLAQASGIGLRTIQRVESEGRGSRETKVCLAATFEVSLEELESSPPLPSNADDVVLPKLVLFAFLLAFAMSAYGYMFIAEPGMTFIAANMVTIATALYIVFHWYFPATERCDTPARKTLKVGFIYSALFLMFASVGQGPEALHVHLSLLVSGLIFCGVYYAVLRYVGIRKRVT